MVDEVESNGSDDVEWVENLRRLDHISMAKAMREWLYHRWRELWWCEINRRERKLWQRTQWANCTVGSLYSLKLLRNWGSLKLKLRNLLRNWGLVEYSSFPCQVSQGLRNFWTPPWLTWCGLNKHPELNLKQSKRNDTQTYTHSPRHAHTHHWGLYNYMTSYLAHAYRPSINIDKSTLLSIVGLSILIRANPLINIDKPTLLSIVNIDKPTLLSIEKACIFPHESSFLELEPGNQNSTKN